MKLSQKIVDRLQSPAGKADAIIFDDDVPGLGVRFQGRTPRWIVQYRVNSRNRRVTLGPVKAIELKEARKYAGKILADARDGKDTQAEREQTKARAGQTLGALLERYIRQYAEREQGPRTLVETLRYLRRDWQPLHAIPLAALTRADIANHAQELAARAPTAGKRALTHLKGALTWGLKQGAIETNPALAVEVGGREKPRDRVLTPAELALLWQVADPATDYGHILHLLLLTGQRRDEVGGMAWSEIDTDKALWTLPGARTKNGRTHEVPLSRQALAVLASVNRRGGRDLLFGRGAGAFSGWSKSKEHLDKRAPLPAWRLHDIRHSVSTHMHEIGIPPHIVEAVINHVSGHKGGVAGRYNHAQYREQKSAALQRWGDWLEGVAKGEPVDGSAVLPFKAVGQ
jgi:integrase